MAKQVKVSLKFEIEEVCLSIFLSGWSSYSSYGSEFFLKFTAKGKLWEQFSDVSRVIQDSKGLFHFVLWLVQKTQPISCKTKINHDLLGMFSRASDSLLVFNWNSYFSFEMCLPSPKGKALLMDIDISTNNRAMEKLFVCRFKVEFEWGLLDFVLL